MLRTFSSNVFLLMVVALLFFPENLHAAPQRFERGPVVPAKPTDNKELAFQLQNLKPTFPSPQLVATTLPQSISTTTTTTTEGTGTHNSSHLSSLEDELDLTPRDIAEYIFWTGDEGGVALDLRTFLEDGVISNEDGLKLLEDIRHNVEWLKSRYDQHPSTGRRREKGEVRMMRDGSLDDERGSNLLRKVGSTDAKFREFSLEGVIYHLAKEIFSKNHGRESDDPEKTIGRLIAFVEHEAAIGKIPRDLQKSILDTLVTALVDVLTERRP